MRDLIPGDQAGPATAAPIACSLTVGALEQRRKEWATLDETSRISRTVRPGRITSLYAPGARLRVEALVAAEAECCPFLTFELGMREGLVELDLVIPPGAEDLVARSLSAAERNIFAGEEGP